MTLTAVALAGLAALGGCSTGGGELASGLDAPDMALAQRYVVAVEVLEASEGCVVGGLTPGDGLAEATVEQQGATVRWYQAGANGVGSEWRLSGHICDGADGRVVRLRGGRAAAVGDGDDFCQANLSLPTRHTGGAKTRNRCEDDRCVALELVPDGCGGLVADFEGRLHFIGERCQHQPDCLVRLRWRATPAVGEPGAETDGGCTPTATGDDGAWMAACRSSL